MSSTAFESKVVKLQIVMLAYNFNNWFRRLCLPKKMKSNRIETFRNKMVKVAGSSYIWVDTGRGNAAVTLYIETCYFEQMRGFSFVAPIRHLVPKVLLILKVGSIPC